MDGLKKVDGPSKLGDFHYVPVLFHGGGSVRKEQRLLLDVCGLLLSRTQGRSPDYGIVWHGRECDDLRSGGAWPAGVDLYGGRAVSLLSATHDECGQGGGRGKTECEGPGEGPVAVTP